MEQIFQDKFKLIFNNNRVGLFLMIFVKPSLLASHRIRVLHDDLIRLGAFNLANKGALNV